jgi:hypothetical protein
LLENYQKARLGEQADNAGSVRFEIVLPPTAPVVPVWPKRKNLLAEIWVAALAVGAGLAYWLQRLRPVVTSLRALKELGGLPVLGVVGVAFPVRRRARFRRHLWGFSAASIVLVAALGIALALNRSGVRLDAQALKTLGLDVQALKALVKA